MAGFAKAAGTLLAINLGLIGMFVFGPGLTVPVPASVSPPSVCIAQLPMYERIGALQSCLVAVLLTSILLCGYVKIEMAALEGEHLAEIGETERRLLHTCLLLSIVTTAASVAMGLATYAYVFQIKVSLLACVSVSARLSLFTSYAMATLVGTFVFYKLARAAATSN